MSESTERHARERLAVIGESMSVSRESIRKAGKVNEYFSDAKDLIMSGEMRVNKMFRLMKAHSEGDHRVGVYLQVQPETREIIREVAKREGLTMSQMVEGLITQIYGYGENE